MLYAEGLEVFMRECYTQEKMFSEIGQFLEKRRSRDERNKGF